jgi:hypothetical protein
MSLFDCCPHYKAADPESDFYEDCSSCSFFYSERTPIELIGVCKCEGLRRVEDISHASL